MKSMNRALVVLVLALAAMVNLGAQEGPRRIDVSGDAEIRVSPDEAVLSLSVESWSPDLAKARKDNDERMAKVLKVPEQFGVDKNFVQTDYLSIEPIYQQTEGYAIQKIDSYRVRKNVTIVLKDLSKLDGLVNSLLNAGANRFDGIEFRSSELRRHRDKARSMAMQAAREKAAAMAGELGQKLLAPLQISELADTPYPSYRMVAQNAVGFAESAGSMGDTMSIGQIVIRAQVSVSFEIAPR